MKLADDYIIACFLMMFGWFLTDKPVFLAVMFVMFFFAALSMLMERKEKSLIQELEFKKFEAICTRLDLILKLLDKKKK